jgi:hypothetical protein
VMRSSLVSEPLMTCRKRRAAQPQPNVRKILDTSTTAKSRRAGRLISASGDACSLTNLSGVALSADYPLCTTLRTSCERNWLNRNFTI